MEYVRLKDINIKDHINKRVFVTFMARDVDVRVQKDNVTKYISMSLVDKDVCVDAKYFGVRDSTIDMIKDGKVYNAAVDVKVFEKSPTGYSCNIYNIDYSEESPKSFVDWAENLAYAKVTIDNYLMEIVNTTYGKIAYQLILQNLNKFMSWTAARGQHHTRLGELAVHTAEVTTLSVNLADYFNEVYGDNFINRPLLIASALLHDLGKIKELDVDTNIGKTSYSTNAALSTHIMDILCDVELQAYKLGLGIISDEELDMIESVSEDSEQTILGSNAVLRAEMEQEQIKLLKHCLAAHHGKLEYGSPKTPSIPEATLLNMADMMSADMYKYNKAFKGLEPGESVSNWEPDGIHVVYKETYK